MILVKEGSAWVPAVLTSYGSEKALQDILADDGSLVPGCAGTAAVTEFGTRAGPIDILYIDAGGVITLVECKLRSNSEIRRKVIGQLIDYASALATMTYDEFAQRFASRAGFALEKAIRATAVDFDRATFRDTVASNLEAGRFRLVIAVDEITESLRRSVEFLNDHSTDDVIFLALELGYLRRMESNSSLLRRSAARWKQLAPARAPPRPPNPGGPPEEIGRAAEDVPDPNSKTFVERLLRHAADNSAQTKGGQNATRVSAGFYYQVATKRPSLWSLWLGDSPEISLNIGAITNVSPEVAEGAPRATRLTVAARDCRDRFRGRRGKIPNRVDLARRGRPHGASAVLAFLDTAIGSRPSMA